MRKLSAIIFGALVLGSSGGAPSVCKQLYGGIDQWAAVCNAAGIKLKGAQVTKVMLGTPAYFSGLREGDKVVKCDVADRMMKITFDRQGKQYAVNVPTDASAVQPGLDPAKTKPAKFLLGEAEALQKLRDFDVIVFLDCSGSMGEDIKAAQMRKWDWASKNIKDFSTKYNSVVKRPITLVTFNDKFNVIPNCSAADLESVFNHRQPDGGTDLATPLESIVDERLRALEQRPCVIVVLHDGISDNEEKVAQILEHIAQQALGAGKIFVTFVQIGDDQAGTNNLKMMEAVNEGGKDIVKTELFDEIRQVGLARVIADAIKDHLPKAPVPAAPAAASKAATPAPVASTPPAKTPPGH